MALLTVMKFTKCLLSPSLNIFFFPAEIKELRYLLDNEMKSCLKSLIRASRILDNLFDKNFMAFPSHPPKNRKLCLVRWELVNFFCYILMPHGFPQHHEFFVILNMESIIHIFYLWNKLMKCYYSTSIKILNDNCISCHDVDCSRNS